MAIARSTVTLRDELQTPTCLQPADFKAASRQFRPVIHRVSEQVSRLQQMLAEVEEDEASPEVRGKLEALRQLCRALQRQHDNCEKEYSTLAHTYAQLQDMAADFASTCQRAELAPANGQGQVVQP